MNKSGFIAQAQLYFLLVSTGTGPPVKQQHYVPSGLLHAKHISLPIIGLGLFPWPVMRLGIFPRPVMEIGRISLVRYGTR